MTQRSSEDWVRELCGDRGQEPQRLAHQELANYPYVVAYNCLRLRQADLRALAVQFVKPANDPAHNCPDSIIWPCPSNEPWSYAVYQTSLRWTDQGDASSVAVQQDDTLELTLQPLHPLILFNLVASLDWKTTPEYRAQLKQGLELGSDYLFDLTDGQMAFGHVVVNDNKAVWDTADIHVKRNNTICPQASIGVLTGGPGTGAIELGPFWDGNYTSGSSWTNSNSFRTIVHEFAHYAFGLYDEYMTEKQAPAVCTAPKDKLPAESVAASAMYYEEGATEFSALDVPGMWSPECALTKQATKNHGQSAWETIQSRFADATFSPARWTIDTPMRRGAVMPGPERKQWPSALPRWPEVSIASREPSDVRDITLTFETSCATTSPSHSAMSYAAVYLFPRGAGPGTDLGKAAIGSEFILLGAQAGDVLCVSANGCFGKVIVSQELPRQGVLTVMLDQNNCNLGDPPSQFSAIPTLAQPSWQLQTQPGTVMEGPPAAQLLAVEPGGLTYDVPTTEFYDATQVAAHLAILPDRSFGSLYLDVQPLASFAALPQPQDVLLGNYSIASIGAEVDEIFSADGTVRLTLHPQATLRSNQQAILLQLQTTTGKSLPEVGSLVGEPTHVEKQENEPATLEYRCISRPTSMPNTAPQPLSPASQASIPASNWQALRYDSQSARWVALDVPVIYNDVANSLTFSIEESGEYAVVELAQSEP